MMEMAGCYKRTCISTTMLDRLYSHSEVSRGVCLEKRMLKLPWRPNHSHGDIQALERYIIL